MTECKRIIVRCPNWVGDVVMATPVLRWLRSHYPEAHISYLLKPYVSKILDGAPWFDEMMELGSGLRGSRAATARLREGKYDLAVLLSNSVGSARMMSQANIPRRVGFDRDRRGRFLTDAVPPPMKNGGIVPIYMSDYFMKLCSHLAGEELSDRRLELFIPPDTEKRLTDLLADSDLLDCDRLILINPGAAFGSSKLWQSESLATVADMLLEKFDCRVAIVAGPGEQNIAQGIAELMRGDATVFSAQQCPLDILKGLIKRCSLLLTTDTGPRHYAVAFQRPTVVLMGPTDPRYTDTDYEKGIVLRSDVWCSPCHIKKCPTDHRCMSRIKPDRVFGECVRLLSSE